MYFVKICLAFNTFLSTSLNEKVPLQFAQKSVHKPDSVGVLFQITVDPSILSTPFAPIKTFSAIPNEDEILFSMHTIFRIGQIKPIEDRLWHVEPTLTNDNDQELKRLTEHMRQEISGSTRWEQLGYLLLKMGNFDKAEEIFKILLEETFQHDEKMHPSLYNYLGDIKYSKGDYKEALKLYQKSLEIRQKYLHLHHSDLIGTYNSIGLIHDHMVEYSKALESYEKSLEIGQTSLPSNRTIVSETITTWAPYICA
jgi:tetratricopeptide (TPR) repeat protein